MSLAVTSVVPSRARKGSRAAEFAIGCFSYLLVAISITLSPYGSLFKNPWSCYVSPGHSVVQSYLVPSQPDNTFDGPVLDVICSLRLVGMDSGPGGRPIPQYPDGTPVHTVELDLFKGGPQDAPELVSLSRDAALNRYFDIAPQLSLSLRVM